MINSKEIIICSAVKTECGQIIRGHRHSDCIFSILKRKMKPLKAPDAQGFITSKNRFVDREEGAKIQNEAKILSKWTGKPINRKLFSEDLY